MTTPAPYLELLDWRRQVAELFAELRDLPPDATTLAWFRAAKDALFRDHPQSPIPAAERKNFSGLAYWPFDPAVRVKAHFIPVETEPTMQGSGELAFSHIGQLGFDVHG